MRLCSKISLAINRHFALEELVCLGGFNNTRHEIAWQGFTLELDETTYPWGTLFELEAETVSLSNQCHEC
jgi:uncharacterized protein YjbK